MGLSFRWTPHSTPIGSCATLPSDAGLFSWSPCREPRDSGQRRASIRRRLGSLAGHCASKSSGSWSGNEALHQASAGHTGLCTIYQPGRKEAA